VRADAVRPGDRLWTMDDGAQPVRWVGTRHITSPQLAAYPQLRPVLIAPGALGHGLPHRPLRLSRQHRVLVASRIIARVQQSDEALIPAFRLTQLPGIILDTSLEAITYVHVLMDHHSILNAEGAPVESLLPADMARRALPALACAHLGHHAPVRPVPAPAQQKAILQRHVKNAVPPLQTYTGAHCCA
jgi:hypothetical protein